MELANPKLYIFAISHFSEKARFILDRSNYSYDPIFLIPGEHLAAVKEFAPATNVPILRGDDFLIQGSNEIIQFLYDLGVLFTIDYKQEMDWVQMIDHTIGYSLQPIVYSYLLDEQEILERIFASNPNQLVQFDNYKMIALGLKRRYKITDANVEIRKRDFLEGVQTLSEAYDRRSFLVGDSLTIADITAASLISSLFFPPEHPNSSWFIGIEYPTSMVDWISGIQDSSYYRRVMEIYKEFRLPRSHY